MVAQKKKIRLGDALVQKGLISDEQLQQALLQQKQSGEKLGRALIEMGAVEEDQVLKLLSEQLELPFIQLKTFQFDHALTQRMPETFARRYRALVLQEDSAGLLVGMTDPSDIFAADEIERILGVPISVAVIRESELLNAMDILYRRTDDITQFAEELSHELGDESFDLGNIEATTDEEAPVVRLLQSIFEDAVQIGASDIHIEPDEKVLRIRQRVDGQLHEQVMNEKRIVPALVLRLKLMSSLNISEKRLPQDGRFSIKIKGHNVDVRLSTMPTQHGESVVMRLLDQSGGIINLDNIGMPPALLRHFRNQMTRPHGLVLVTGPTGSGKTTTLYGALQELNIEEKKIITVEDPVEYTLPRIQQVQVHEKVGLTFGAVLRASLRQDPDILLVGEIRDQETAEIALRAAMTGHLVLSTLHTNDAITSAMRLIDVGAEGYLVASSLRAVVAQRLVRRLCEICIEEYQPDSQEQAWLENLLEDDNSEHRQYYKGRGCAHCNNTGYRGRIGVFELLEVDTRMADALRRSDAADFAKAARSQPNYRSLAHCALDYALEKVTSLDEVFRVSEQIEEDIELMIGAA